MKGNPAYPMWVIVCTDCGPQGSLWEKPGTAAPYVEYCPGCGGSQVTTERVESKEEHEQVKEGR